jgi:hypothetical protein
MWHLASRLTEYVIVCVYLVFILHAYQTPGASQNLLSGDSVAVPSKLKVTHSVIKYSFMIVMRKETHTNHTSENFAVNLLTHVHLEIQFSN